LGKLQFYLHHVLHSLSIARVIKFPEKSCVVDVGSGGGFPGIPLAVLFPDVEFVLLDSIQKKIRASENIGKTLDINNLSFVNERAENHNQQYDYIIARAVAAFPKFSRQTKHLIRKSGSLKRQGIYYLKGGDLADELKLFPEVQQFNISAFFPEPFFETKKVIYMPA
jgi:16S rRNA (guanine527-N7)-methyltransferase